jgi:hypothetical protein
MANHIVLSVGGQALKASAIKLFPSDKVGEWRGLTALAQQQLGGFSTGLGFWGSPEWAIGGAIGLGILEGAISNAKAKEGVVTLQRANEALQALRSSGALYSVRDIQNITVPIPTGWFAQGRGKKTVQMNTINFLERSRFLADHGVTKQDVSNGSVQIDTVLPYVTLGEDFLNLVVEGQGEVQVRWSAVDAFQVA